MPTNEERREVARKIREAGRLDYYSTIYRIVMGGDAPIEISRRQEEEGLANRLADLIDPDTQGSDDAEWRRWYDGLCHTDGDDSPESLREVLEDIVWAVLTIDLGPNGNVCQGVDEGIVQTDSLFDAWEREIRAAVEPETERTCHRVWHSGTVRSDRAKCSECGYGITDRRFVYCPKCGAKIEEDS